jgi:acetolactate synthase I/II/III large subunit
MSAAHAYAMVTGEPQAVIVHVHAGTQNLGGTVNNAMRGRVPVLIFAGSAPFTQDGELPGGRNEFIHWVQDVRDQRGILRNYVKYDNEIRTGRNVKQLVHRAMQLARSEPAGPVPVGGAQARRAGRAAGHPGRRGDGLPRQLPVRQPAAHGFPVPQRRAESRARRG